jgi:hypothetical protein
VRIEGTHKTQAERRKAGRDIARNEVTVRAFTIKAKSLESAQSLFDALSRFDPILHGYSVSVDVGKGDRRIPEMLDAIHRHVEKGAQPHPSRAGRAALQHPADGYLACLGRLSASQDGDASSRSCRPRIVRQRPSPSTRQ